jgi:hypothetical protein
MATSGEKTWPPPGRKHGRHRGEPMAAHGEKPMAVDTPVDPPNGPRRRPPLCRPTRILFGYWEHDYE